MLKLTKYVIFRDVSGAERAVILPQSLSHDRAVNPGAERPVSAGFFCRANGLVILSQIASTTLGLGPRPQDADLISETLNA